MNEQLGGQIITPIGHPQIYKIKSLSIDPEPKKNLLLNMAKSSISSLHFPSQNNFIFLTKQLSNIIVLLLNLHKSLLCKTF